MNNKAEYTPEKVVDISNLSREDWLEYRKKGIGGSDVAAIMGISPFATIRDLFYNKTGVQPVIQEEEESNWVAKEVGHRLEDLVAEIFSKKTGLEVFPVRVMFRHPLYPFMLADVDFFVRMPDGKFSILECKTCNYNAKDKWADEGIPAHYVLQVRHYLSVMNMQKAFIACLYGNNENEFVYRTIERDLIEEEDMEDSFQVDWLSRTFNTIKLDKEISYSISAFYEESFPEWENQYVSIKGIDESYFYPLPKIEGRTFSKNELQEGKDVCLMNKQYARMHACEIGDMIQIRDKRLKVIGLIDNSVYSGMIIPYQTMLNVYKEEKDIQFSGTFFCENELQKQKRIDEVIEQIKEKDNHADILGVTEGEELYKNALYTKIQWRIVRGMCALVAILFFMINETIVLMAKAKKERKIMGINLALGATERDIKYCLFFETLLVTLLAVFLVMITLRPLAKLASLEHIIILDSMVIVETVILAVWACEILTWIIVSRIKKENIADMVRTTRDI